MLVFYSDKHVKTIPHAQPLTGLIYLT